MEAVREKIKEYITKNILFLERYPYADGVSFLDTGDFDSTSVLELVMFVENEFKISVQDSEIVPMNFDSIDALENFVSTRMSTNN
jgi:acyl carrier protein